jgi:hypothetical protein
VPAALFALGRLAGDARLVLGAVAAGNAALVYWLTAAAFDRRTGLVAGAALLASPLFLLNSAVFLPYAPTTLLNLAFAAGYVAAARRNSLRLAARAGAALGLAVFARPYTAFLFAAPFVAHAGWTLFRRRNAQNARSVLARQLAVAGPALGGVALSLGYNALVTGDPLVFPYEAFAPRDGLGFGRRALLGYERSYTPALALETTRRVLATLLTEWTAAGPVGTALAALGVVLAGRHQSGRWTETDDGGLPAGELRVVLAALIPSVVVGNAYFWGSLNGLTNGLFDLLGPYYHFDLLLPLSAFAAAGLVDGSRRVSGVLRRRLSGRSARVAMAVLLLTSVPAVASVEADVLGGPVAANQDRTETLATTYAPIREASFARAVVFTPDTYGDWQAHPFQYLRNDPGFDGEVLYATGGPPSRTFAALRATGNRTPYRFTYRGEWNGATGPVTPALVPLREVAGDRVAARTTVGVPNGSVAARVRVETDAGYVRYAVPDPPGPGESLAVNWTVGPAAVRAPGLDAAAGTGATLPTGPSAVALVVTFVDSTGGTVSYRQTVAVARTDRGVRAVWPPETRVCRFQTDCGRRGTWVGASGDYLGGVEVSSSATARNATDTR